MCMEREKKKHTLFQNDAVKSSMCSLFVFFKCMRSVSVRFRHDCVSYIMSCTHVCVSYTFVRFQCIILVPIYHLLQTLTNNNDNNKKHTTWPTFTNAWIHLHHVKAGTKFNSDTIIVYIIVNKVKPWVVRSLLYLHCFFLWILYPHLLNRIKREIQQQQKTGTNRQF